jgi:ferritin
LLAYKNIHFILFLLRDLKLSVLSILLFLQKFKKLKNMKKVIEDALNEQIYKEEYSSRFYLAAAIWCETNGFPGAAKFLYTHAEEERMHMMKLIHYVNDRGGVSKLVDMKEPPQEFNGIQEIFTKIKKHEEFITDSINELYGLTVAEKDYTTGNFLQWYISEQIEEESLFNTIIDKLNLVGDSKASLFHIDKEFETLSNMEGQEGNE